MSDSQLDPPAPDPTGPDLSTGRLEAFSDGVFAIAITLLVLDLVVPPRDERHGESLAAALGHEWPAYFAYLVSFLVIGIIWVNHHALCGLVRRVDRLTLFANLFLLLTVSVIPFPTRLLAEYLTAGADAHTAAAVYSGTMLMMAIAFTLLFLALTRDARALHRPVDPATARATLRRFGAGVILYALTVGLAFVGAVATLTVHAALAVYYCFDQLAPARRRR
ncbi:TMEM175 family protein [Plantactinospora siamensis]|uniref:TMEM175 family protein n=1 Tax=Plantactinospora siamensis TaxID=555372 RepID=A0ABV6NWR3_9ACTN